MSKLSRLRQFRALVPTGFGAIGLAWTVSGITRICLPERDEASTAARLGNAAIPAPLEGRAAERDQQKWKPLLRFDPATARDLEPHFDSIEMDQALEAAALLQRYFSGEPVDFGAVVLAPEAVSDFDRKVYALAREVPWGRVTTYGAIAGALGGPAMARAVGQALGNNPTPIIVPCHRVLAAAGRLGGFSAYGGRLTKQRLLELEKAPIQLALL